MSNNPTIKRLDVNLKDLVKWEQFALHLPEVLNRHIEAIKNDYPNDIVGQKMALYDKWLRLCPNASWKDVVEALETADENTIAKGIRDTYYPVSDGVLLPQQEIPETSSSTMLTNKPMTMYEKVAVNEDMSTDLERLQESFLQLLRNVKSAVEVSIFNGSIKLKWLKDEILEQRTFTITSLESVTTTDELFNALRPHYNFLRCHLIIFIGKLLSGDLADEAKQYDKQIKLFKQSANVKCLKDILHKHYPENHEIIVIVKIVVEDCWGEESLRLVEILIETLFPMVKHSDSSQLQWYQVTSGSLVLSFIGLRHMASILMKQSRSKIGFMKLVGIISLSIGDQVVWEQDEEIRMHTLENFLIQATLADNLETVEFLLEHAKVDANVTYDSTVLIDVAEESYYSKLEVKEMLPSYYKTFTELLKDVEYYSPHSQLDPLELLQNKEVQVVFTLLLSHNFLSDKILADDNLMKILPQLSNRIKAYRNSIVLLKRQTTVKYLSDILPKYIPQSLPNYRQILIILQKPWGECSIHYIEQLGKLIFSSNLFHHFQLIRVETDGVCCQVTFLAPNHLIHIMNGQIASKNRIFWQSLGGIRILVDHELHFDFNARWNPWYRFVDAIYFAKKNGDDGKVIDLLKQVSQAPKDFKEIVCTDNNDNYGFLLHPGSTPLIIACCKDNSAMVQLLLRHKANPNKSTTTEALDKNLNALMYSTGNTKLYKMLIDHGADISALAVNKTTLYCACLVGNMKVVKLLLSLNHKLVHIKDNNGDLPLHAACIHGHIEIVYQLLKEKADPNIKNEFSGQSPLMMASLHGFTEIVQQLLQVETIDTSLQDKEGLTALMLASFKGHFEIVKLLVDFHSDPNVRSNTNGVTAFHFACLNGHIKVVKFLLQAKCDPVTPDDKQHTALQLASKNGHTEIVKLLLKINSPTRLNIDIQDLDNWTPLMTASRYGHSEIAELLLIHGANPNVVSVDGWTALMLACANGHLSTVNLLLNQANLSIRNKTGFTAFYLASKYGYTEIIKLLIKGNTNLNIRDNEGLTPLMAASRNGHVNVVDLLLCHNVDPNTRGHKSECTALMLATTDDTRHIAVVDRLLQSEADPNIQSTDGWTALMLASKFGQVQIVQRLLQVKQTNINLQKNDGVSALMLANIESNFEVVRYLLEASADPNLQDESGSTVLMKAASIGNEELVKSLVLKFDVSLDIQDINGQSALHFACTKGHTGIVEFLVKKNANPNIYDNNEATALMFAILEFTQPRPITVDLAPQTSVTLDSLTMVVEWLLKYNANPNAKDVDGLSPLLIACTLNLTAIVNLLLEYDADPNIQDNTGSTPLMRACTYGYEVLVCKLIESKANVNIVSNKGESPLMMASSLPFTSIVKKLIEFKADLNSKAIDGRSPLMYACGGIDVIEVIECLLQAKADPNAQDKNGRTPLIVACCADNQQIALRLLQENIDVNVQVYLPEYKNKMTALMIACERGQEEAVSALLKKPNINLNIRDSKGQTALMIAIRFRKFEIAKNLIRHKADVNVQDKDGQTPILEAFWNQCLDVFRLLLQNHADPSIKNNRRSSALKVIFDSNPITFSEYVTALKETGHL